MKLGKLRYGRIAGVIVIGGLLILGFLLMLGGDSKKPSTPVNVPKSLSDYAGSSATVGLTTKGAINARENHREIRVIVGRSSRSIEIVRGYNNEVIRAKSYPNSKAAYSEFLYALSYSQFTRSRSSNVKTEEGVCALGNRYVLTLEQGGRDVSRLWTSTCSGIGKGTFGGSIAQILTLFEAQIPDYDKLTQNISLR